MKCDNCGAEIVDKDDSYEHGERTLCEDCYLDVAARPKMCDPWAVHGALSSSKLGGVDVNETQQRILDFLQETGGAELEVVAEKLGLGIPELERELAALRHVEKIKGQMREGKKVVCLW